jgi:hypothetical protein
VTGLIFWLDSQNCPLAKIKYNQIISDRKVTNNKKNVISWWPFDEGTGNRLKRGSNLDAQQLNQFGV